MNVGRRSRLGRLSKRKALAYALSVIIFAAAMWAAMRLSFPPDPFAGRGHRAAAHTPPVHVQTDRDRLTITRGRESRTYQLRETDNGLVAEEVAPEQ